MANAADGQVVFLGIVDRGHVGHTGPAVRLVRQNFIATRFDFRESDEFAVGVLPFVPPESAEDGAGEEGLLFVQPGVRDPRSLRSLHR